MPRILLAAALALLLLSATGAGPIPDEVDPQEFETAARTILCDCGCHPQSVWDCACGRAAEMRREIAGEIRGGMSGDQVVLAYVERHGEQIRVAPTASGFNLVAWLGPGLALIGAAFGTVLLLRRWRRGSPVAAAAAGTSAPTEQDQEYRARLARELREYDV